LHLDIFEQPEYQAFSATFEGSRKLESDYFSSSFDPSDLGFFPKNGRMKKMRAMTMRTHDIGRVKKIEKSPLDMRRERIKDPSTISLMMKPMMRGAPS
jgi:hypothetical protein